MEVEAIQNIRDSNRNLVKLNRRYNKESTSDRLRHLPTSSNSDTIVDIINKLKTKSATSFEELNLLKNALAEDTKYIEAVLSTHGALRGLTREISGHDAKKLCEAAGCLCNMALGDEKACLVLSKACGSYLVNGLDSMGAELAVNSAWAIGNLAASSLAVCEVLMAQGALAKLIVVMEDNNDILQVKDKSHDDSIFDAAVYAVEHFLHHLRDNLVLEYLQKLLRIISKGGYNQSVSRLLFMLSCHKDFTSAEDLDERFLQLLLDNLTLSTGSYITFSKDTLNSLLYLVRTLANISVNSHVCDIVVRYLVESDISKCLYDILSTENELADSVLWFLGNLFNYANDSVYKSKLFLPLS